jgi:hypothetical protein
MARARLELTGQRFGRLVVQRFSCIAIPPSYRSRWVCLCDCGRSLVADGANLRQGLVKSCGCLRREKSPENGKRSYFAGASL